MSRIVVVGSINMDVINLVDKHPIPGETIHGRGTSYSPGGKGANQAVAASLAGGTVEMIGAVGTDPFGKELIASLERFGVGTGSVLQKEGTSGMAFITVDASGENNIILSAGSNGKLSGEDVSERAAAGLLDGAAAVLLQNEIPWATTELAIREANARGVKVYMNPAPAVKLPREVLSRLDVLIVNESEAETITEMRVRELADANNAAKELIAHGVKTVIVTLGEKGSLYVESGGAEPVYTPAYKVKPIDTTAAGDTFIGAFAAARESGEAAANALRFATAAAAITVTRKGAQISIPRKDEIERFLKEESL